MGQVEGLWAVEELQPPETQPRSSNNDSRHYIALTLCRPHPASLH